jgi:hypothetical protein
MLWRNKLTGFLMKGINEFSGETLAAFIFEGAITQGQTYPVTLIMKEGGQPISVIGYTLSMVFRPIDNCVGSDIKSVVDIPVIEEGNPRPRDIVDPKKGTFSGCISAVFTKNLPVGDINISIEYTDANGTPYIQDMAQCHVYSGI